MSEFSVGSTGEIATVEDRGYAVRLWDHDFLLVAEKPVSQKIESFVAEYVAPGSYLHMTVDRPGGDRWSGRAGVSVTLTSDYEWLKAMQAWSVPFE